MTPEHTALAAQLEKLASNAGRMGEWPAAAYKAAAAIRELSQQRDEARALQRDYRREQILAENDAAMVRAVWSNLQPKLEAEVAALKTDNQTLRDLLAVAEERNEL